MSSVSNRKLQQLKELQQSDCEICFSKNKKHSGKFLYHVFSKKRGPRAFWKCRNCSNQWTTAPLKKRR